MKMPRRILSFRWLEVFQLVAKYGSVQAVAKETGLSTSTVSHHLRSLEASLGVHLLDHSRRPMILTSAGAVYLRYVEDGMQLIRRGELEITSGNPANARDLRLGLVEDFDSEVAPELAKFLAKSMPKCAFKHHTRPSHEIIDLLLNQKLDVGIAARPMHDLSGLVEHPLLNDPFVLVTPASDKTPPKGLLAGTSDLPFLRYSFDQTIGVMIEVHLRRIKASLPNRFELESNQSLFGLVAEGNGWAITTPASYVRAKRFHNRVALHPLPGKGFSRTLSIYTADAHPQMASKLIAGSMQRLLARYFVDPVTAQMPWLSSSFRVVSENPDDGQHAGTSS